jgi:regulator of replication initiation timing
VNKPQIAIETLPYCINIVPNIKLFLQIFTTLSVTTATLERTFSILKRLKTYRRSTMTENRLNGLALVNINKKEVISETEIIEDLAKNAQKKLQLVDWSK